MTVTAKLVTRTQEQDSESNCPILFTVEKDTVKAYQIVRHVEEAYRAQITPQNSEINLGRRKKVKVRDEVKYTEHRTTMLKSINSHDFSQQPSTACVAVASNLVAQDT